MSILDLDELDRLAELRARVTVAVPGARRSDAMTNDPSDDKERAAVAELRRVIDLCSANLEQWGVG